MYLTHIDADGNDSPAILIDNATASNRAVNIPEFVNVAPDGLRRIGGPVLDYYRLFNDAAYLQRKGRYQESAAKWKQVVELNPDDELAHRNLGTVLLMTGQREESGVHFRQASELKLRAAVEADPTSARRLSDLAWVLATSPDASIRNGGEALGLAVRAVEISGGKDARMLDTLAAAYAEKGQFANAVLTARRAQALAAQQNQAALADAIGSRIALYESDRPFRER
jgi:tetratricopeptide (TPR) repeat protein